MPTPGSPASSRISVGTETPRRVAQETSDSFLRNLATARSAPRRSSADSVDGGSCISAIEVLGITKILLIKMITCKSLLI
ncbi:MAG: hypothetical protein IPP85_07305 [Propionivibrio sp.]|nr:hypothetical protein [Propionivibrio sp.]